MEVFGCDFNGEGKGEKGVDGGNDVTPTLYGERTNLGIGTSSVYVCSFVCAHTILTGGQKSSWTSTTTSAGMKVISAQLGSWVSLGR